MPRAATAADFSALLEHSMWVRRLAGVLVRDDARADDLAQEAWVAAMRHPPAAGLPVRPWLSQVVRNLARMRFRGERRRSAREDAVARQETVQAPAAADSPEQLVERVQTQRALAGLVIALAEPYRSTVLLRYYEGLSAAEIATRQGVPAGTVRWRLKEGLDRLRAELDHTHGGDRRAWLPVLAPLAAAPADAGGAGVPTAANIKGVMTMKPLLPIAIVLSGAVAGVVATRTPTAPPPGAAASVAARPAAKAGAGAPSGRLDKQQRAVLLQQIQQAQRRFAPAPSATLPRAATADVPVLDKDYIRAQMQTLIPLIKECYETALLRHRFDGKLVVDFTIVAAKDIGGLVTDSTINSADSTITDDAMRECVQETMYGARFPAPDDGGEVHVSYPFVFQAD